MEILFSVFLINMAPFCAKYLRAKQLLFMTKEIHKPIKKGIN